MTEKKQKYLSLILTTISADAGERIAIVQTGDDFPDKSHLFAGWTWQGVRKKIEEKFPPSEWEISGSPVNKSKLFSEETT